MEAARLPAEAPHSVPSHPLTPSEGVTRVHGAPGGQAALEGVPVPPFSLNLPGTVWGIDPSSKRIAVAALTPGDPVDVWWETLSLPVGAGAQQFSRGYDAQAAWFEQMVRFRPPAFVFIEEPFVPRDHRGAPAHLFMFGVTLAALGAVTDCHVRTLSQSVWKSKALGAGFGNARKPRKASDPPYPVMTWAREVVGYTGRLEDEADAIGVVTAGGVLVSSPARGTE